MFGKGGFGREVKSYFPWVHISDSRLNVSGDRFNVAIADPHIREEVFSKCGLPLIKLIHSSAIIGWGNCIGPGAIICPWVTITCDANIGKLFHANIYSYVAHDCLIGDFVTFSPRVCCNGNVTIGNRVFVGTGAMIKPGVVIGDDAVVGMGAVVIKDVKSGTTVVGNPSRCLS